MDYSKRSGWYIAPEHGDKHDADTFFVLPTCGTAESDSCGVTCPSMRREALLYKPLFSRVFNSTRVYSPWYTQVTMTRFVVLQEEGGWDAAQEEVDKVALPGVLSAFRLFLEHTPKHRPLVLAGHSQGSMVIRSLILWLRENKPEVLNRLAAAYLIGIPVTDAYLAESGLPFAVGRDDTGVIVSYNTMAPHAEESRFAPDDALAINPINWRRDYAYAPRHESLGSLIVASEADYPYIVKPRFADAVLLPTRSGVITTADVTAQSFYPKGVLHSYDYMLYAEDLRRNVYDRVCAKLEAGLRLK